MTSGGRLLYEVIQVEKRSVNIVYKVPWIEPGGKLASYARLSNLQFLETSLIPHFSFNNLNWKLE